MAEVAGLVIGGVGLLGLVDSCINALDYVDAGRKYGKDYQKTALKISVLQLRLSRWKESVDIREDVTGLSGRVQVATEEEAENVRELLGHIKADLKTAEETSQRYKLKNAPPAEQGTEAATMETLSIRVRKMSLGRQNGSSFGQKTRWALHDKKKFGDLVSDLDGNINSLVTLFPAAMQKQTRLAKTELEEIIQPSEIEEPVEAAAILRETSEGIDAQLVAAIERAAAAAQGGINVNRSVVEGQARVQYGDYIAPGERPGQHRANITVNDAVARGNARAQFGNTFGGRYFLDDDFHDQVHGHKSAGAGRDGQQMGRYNGRGGYPGRGR